MSVTVLQPGLQTTIQAGPRSGMRHLGVPASGAADPLSLAVANKLAGNAWDAAALESTLLGPTLRFEADCAVAISGATTRPTVNGDAVSAHETVFVTAGDVLDVGAAEAGARAYLAFAGGLAADVVLGSASTYLPAVMGGYRGRALEEGDVLTVRGGPARPLATPAEFRVPMSSSWGLRACRSFETDCLDEHGKIALFDTNWTVARRADRMGMQLEGAELRVSSAGRMPSAAVFPGTVQCPENGLPFVLSVDAGTVGGYPRIAQVTRTDRHLLGQLRPGDHIRLLLRRDDEAATELRDKLRYWQRWLEDIGQII